MLDKLRIISKDNDNCFVYALRVYAIENDNELLEQIDNIKRDIKTRDLPISKIQEIANKYNLHITIRRDEDNKNLRHFGDKKLKEMKAGVNVSLKRKDKYLS